MEVGMAVVTQMTTASIIMEVEGTIIMVMAHRRDPGSTEGYVCMPRVLSCRYHSYLFELFSDGRVFGICRVGEALVAQEVLLLEARTEELQGVDSNGRLKVVWVVVRGQGWRAGSQVVAKSSTTTRGKFNTQFFNLSHKARCSLSLPKSFASYFLFICICMEFAIFLWAISIWLYNLVLCSKIRTDGEKTCHIEFLRMTHKYESSREDINSPTWFLWNSQRWTLQQSLVVIVYPNYVR